ncbi:translation elongation factor Ts [Mycoplasmopsis opalescens]|uniref:translation elongation factor Ts n=1 Tax=Mycoplasmopsis opalescens TaxID=114886 RepID=UPI0004A75FDF|nr:translation elongation factor Ts [Mycoplasmopsis opalescens]
MDKMALIKELRDRTNGGMMDCKKALEESDWDVEKAISWLKKNGKIKAAKKAGRISAEGLTATFAEGKHAVMFEINCETDFVAKNEDFKKIVNLIGEALLKTNSQTTEEALEVKLPSGETVAEAIESLTAKIGEKISFRRFVNYVANENESIAHYTHITGQIAAVVKVKGENAEVARNVAMHLAAMKPDYIFPEEIPAEKLAVFESEFKVPDNFDKKPEKVQQMIKEGHMNKKIAEVVLVKQPLMLDESVTIEEYLKRAKLTLVAAQRYLVGEGIEKVESDFAAEVAAQMTV